MIIFILLKLLFFSGVLFAFGWQLVRFILNEKRIEALIPLSTIVGIGSYLFLLNLTSYFIKIQTNFYLISAVFLIISLVLFLFIKKEKPVWGINKKWRYVILITFLLIAAVFGIFAAQHLDGEELGLVDLPAASTIAEGNFPAKWLSVPRVLSQHHYAPQLLTAAISKITDMPLWFASDFQITIFLGILFLTLFLLISDFCKDNFRAYSASLLAILGGGLSIFYGIKGIPILYSKYILHQAVDAPFKFADNMIFGKGFAGRPLLINFYHAWTPLSFILLAAVIYLYFRAVRDGKNYLKITLLNTVLLSLLALSNETSFMILFSALLGYPIFLLITERSWKTAKPFLSVSVLLVTTSVLIASFQGGIFTEFIKEKFSEYSNLLGFKISLSFEHILNGELLIEKGFAIKLFSLDFILSWGLLLILIIPASIYLLKRRFHLGSFLLLLSLLFFAPPFFMDAGTWHGDILRIFFTVTFLWSLIVGFFLSSLLAWLKNKYSKLLIIISILFIASQGLLFYLISPIFPGINGRSPSSSSLWGTLPKPSELEMRAVSWIKENTAFNDYFMTFEGDAGFVGRNHKFIMRTGRFAPVFFYDTDPKYFSNLEDAIPERALYKRVIEECDAAAISALNYRYLYVNEHWPQGLEEKCLDQLGFDLQLKFEEVNSGEIARIYLVK